MPENDIAVGRTVQMNTDLDSALEQVEAALKSEGFGILTEIDVKATLKKKIDVDEIDVVSDDDFKSVL